MKISHICSSCGEEFNSNKYQKRNTELCVHCYLSEIQRNPELIQKRKNTYLEKYGVDNPNKLKEIRDKITKTKKDKYGFEGGFQDPKHKDNIQASAHTYEANQKRIETSMKKWGVPHYTQSPEWQKMNQERMLKTKGYKHPMQNPEIAIRFLTNGKVGGAKNYWFEDQFFDSSWELAYYLWLRDTGKKFIYHPKTPLNYVEDGIDRVYYPDFLVEGEFIEIKGTQFFNEKGEPFNKYIGKFWWGKYEAIKKNNVKLMFHEEMKEYLSYVKGKYGKTFLKDHRIRKESKNEKR